MYDRYKDVNLVKPVNRKTDDKLNPDLYLLLQAKQKEKQRIEDLKEKCKDYRVYHKTEYPRKPVLYNNRAIGRDNYYKL